MGNVEWRERTLKAERVLVLHAAAKGNRHGQVNGQSASRFCLYIECKEGTQGGAEENGNESVYLFSFSKPFSPSTPIQPPFLANPPVGVVCRMLYNYVLGLFSYVHIPGNPCS